LFVYVATEIATRRQTKNKILKKEAWSHMIIQSYLVS